MSIVLRGTSLATNSRAYISLYKKYSPGNKKSYLNIRARDICLNKNQAGELAYYLKKYACTGSVDPGDVWITSEWLTINNACPEVIEWWEDDFPNGLIINKEILNNSKFMKGLELDDLYWFADTVFTLKGDRKFNSALYKHCKECLLGSSDKYAVEEIIREYDLSGNPCRAAKINFIRDYGRYVCEECYSDYKIHYLEILLDHKKYWKKSLFK